MSKETKHIDQFLRGSLEGLKIEPHQSVWKGVSKRLILVELLRLNFTNVGKSWLYTGLATVGAVAGITYFSLTQEPESAINNNSEINPQKELIIDSQEDPSPETKVIVEETTDNIASTNESKAAKQISSLPNTSSTINKTKTDHIANTNSKSAIKSETTSYKKEDKLKNLVSSDQHPSSTLSKLDTRNTKLEILDNSSNELLTKIAIKSLSAAISDPVSEDENELRNKAIDWNFSAYYNPEWPMSAEEMYVTNRQFGLKVGMEFKKWSAQLGIGLRTESTPSKYRSFYSSYDSVGFFYDIDYYEVVQGYPDSIIIHYTIESLFDSVEFESETKGPNQKQKWIVIPFELGYQLYQTRKYELNAHILAQFGWKYSSEKSELNLGFSSASSTENISPEAQSNFLQLGIGLENNFNVFPHWWVYAEPRINYYTKKPYQLNNTDKSGPFSIGIQVGVKYKLKGR